MAAFLLEIGTEELPARFLTNEAKDLQCLFARELAEAGLDYGKMRVMATPRRLVIHIDDLAEEQESREEELTGPPVAVAYDGNGKPTKALLGFANTHGVDPDSVYIVKRGKGEYIAAKRKSGGKKASELLGDICSRAIAAIPFGKSMKWGNGDFRYARPLRWLLALLDSDVVEFGVGDVKSGRQTFGHRIHGPGPFPVQNPEEYWAILKEKCQVEPDPDKRKKRITENANRLAQKKGGIILWKDSLLDEVAGLVEHPVPMLGNFDPAYLNMPEEVLLTSMETHQKSFGVRDAAGKLLPYFMTVLNIESPEPEKVQKGWERVLKARLEDAHYFWTTDLKQSFSDWLQKLDSVIYVSGLGSMGEKSQRLEELCGWLAGKIDPELAPVAERAGKLAKADLVSGMVGEFDVLQGIMGGIYAGKAGEDAEVAAAIRDQYLPAGPDSPLPETLAGAILAVADKADTLAGCFGLNKIPTGAADPNGLRRCALGIIRIFLARGITLDIASFFQEARKLYGERNWKLTPEEALDKLLAFFKGRLRQYFISQGYDGLVVDAVLDAGFRNLPDCKARLDALASFVRQEHSATLLQTLKRIENISAKSEHSGAPTKSWNDGLLQEEAEKRLASALARELPSMDDLLAKGAYPELLARLEILREPVDSFFDKVMVMCEDAAIRANRLSLLNNITQRFSPVARFAALQI